VPYEHSRVWAEADFRLPLWAFNPDVVLADYMLPSFDGCRALNITRTTRPDLPFIFVSATLGQERAVEALKHGAVAVHDLLSAESFALRELALPKGYCAAVSREKARPRGRFCFIQRNRRYALSGAVPRADYPAGSSLGTKCVFFMLPSVSSD
jgi:CheY-like chemotaxis protein